MNIPPLVDVARDPNPPEPEPYRLRYPSDDAEFEREVLRAIEKGRTPCVNCGATPSSTTVCGVGRMCRNCASSHNLIITVAAGIATGNRIAAIESNIIWEDNNENE